MTNLSCPWCDELLPHELVEPADQGSCPECLTSWTYVEEPPTGIAAAA